MDIKEKMESENKINESGEDLSSFPSSFSTLHTPSPNPSSRGRPHKSKNKIIKEKLNTLSKIVEGNPRNLEEQHSSLHGTSTSGSRVDTVPPKAILVAPPHTEWTGIKLSTVRCTRCSRKNDSILYCCTECGVQICTPCTTLLKECAIDSDVTFALASGVLTSDHHVLPGQERTIQISVRQSEQVVEKTFRGSVCSIEHSQSPRKQKKRSRRESKMLASSMSKSKQRDTLNEPPTGGAAGPSNAEKPVAGPAGPLVEKNSDGGEIILPEKNLSKEKTRPPNPRAAGDEEAGPTEKESPPIGKSRISPLNKDSGMPSSKLHPAPETASSPGPSGPSKGKSIDPRPQFGLSYMRSTNADTDDPRELHGRWPYPPRSPEIRAVQPDRLGAYSGQNLYAQIGEIESHNTKARFTQAVNEEMQKAQMDDAQYSSNQGGAAQEMNVQKGDIDKRTHQAGSRQTRTPREEATQTGDVVMGNTQAGSAQTENTEAESGKRLTQREINAQAQNLVREFLQQTNSRYGGPPGRATRATHGARGSRGARGARPTGDYSEDRRGLDLLTQAAQHVSPELMGSSNNDGLNALVRACEIREPEYMFGSGQAGQTESTPAVASTSTESIQAAIAVAIAQAESAQAAVATPAAPVAKSSAATTGGTKKERREAAKADKKASKKNRLTSKREFAARMPASYMAPAGRDPNPDNEGEGSGSASQAGPTVEGRPRQW